MLTVNVLARGVDDVNQFMENLDRTNAFFDLHSRQEQTTDDGQIESALEMTYQPGPVSAETPSPAGHAAPATPGRGDRR